MKAGTAGALAAAILVLVACGGGGGLESASVAPQKRLQATAAPYDANMLYQFFAVAFNAAPGVTYMGQLLDAANYGLTIKEIVNIFTLKEQFTSVYPATLSNAQFASRLVDNVVGDSATPLAKQAAADDIVSALALPGWTRGDVIFAIFTNLAGMPATDADWAGTAARMKNQVLYARYYTEVMKGDTTTPDALRKVIANVTENSDTTGGMEQAILNSLMPVTLSIFPAKGATGISVDTFTGIEVSTDSTLDASSITTASVTLKAGVDPVPGTVSGVGAKAFRFSPAGKLKPGQTYALSATVNDTIGGTLVVDSTFTMALTPADLTLDCSSSDQTRVNPIDPVSASDYGFENNTWGVWGYGGSNVLTDWTQCMGSAFAGPNNVVARWTWDFSKYTINDGGFVKSYPEIVYGFKPSGYANGSSAFPKRVSTIQSIPITWNMEIDNSQSTNNVAFDVWLSSTASPTSLTGGIVNAELMIWLDCVQRGSTQGWCTAPGESVLIDGKEYVYSTQPAPVPGNPRYILFRSVQSQLGAGSLNLASFLTFLKARAVISDADYVDDIELGTEIAEGKGELRLNSYSITIN